MSHRLTPKGKYRNFRPLSAPVAGGFSRGLPVCKFRWLVVKMFGIGLPELILIMAVALIVVGPEKLPDLARGLAKQFFELKKAANVLKDSLQEEELLSGKPPDDQTSPIGFSRPEQLAAEAMKAQGVKYAEPGSPRQEVLDLADAAPKAEPVAAAHHQEPPTVEAEVVEVEVSGTPEPKPTGETSGKADA